MKRLLFSLIKFSQKELVKGRSTQPSFKRWQLLLSFIGGLIAISCLGILSNLSTYSLLIAPFGASTVLLFGAPNSPLAQPRNLIFGNLIGAISAVLCVFFLGSSFLACGIAVGLAIALGQAFRCLHPPAGAVALLGVFLKASPIFILIPVLSGSLILLGIAFAFHRSQKREQSYPLHWL
ncbi:HPP family protein [uncultured Prochlorococcus sp.]|uniref:HPP family protein n=1 Tax=uncultured Prochlorococcus sp. TaxID=159733 RepID=UPI0025848C34|nr:HPP family protein [uncultured Prochlorococcus sp.]